MIKVAITGNICSGKTFVLNILKTSGYHTFSSDEIIKNDIYKMTGVKDKISKNFPGTININGDINIDHLAKLIFGKVKKRKMLENIIYPHLTLLRKKFIYRSYLLGAKLSFYEVPLLFEKNLQSNFDKVILVTCSKRIRKIRAQKRENLDNEKLQNILKSQISDSKKIKKVNFIINTDLDKFSTVSKIKAILKEIRRLG